MRIAIAYAIAAVIAATVALSAARRLDSLPPGLTAEYSSSSAGAGTGRAPFTRIEAPPSTTGLVEAWGGSPPGVFGATWVGSIAIVRGGTYTFAINADAGSAAFIDGRAIFDNVRYRNDQFASGSIDLARGAHTVFLSYAHDGGAPRLDFLWAQDHGPLESVPAWALRPRKVGTLRLMLSIVLGAAPVVLGWAWAAVLAAVGAVAATAAAAATRRSLERHGLWRELRWILAGSLALSLPGIWWGLPAPWVPIELTPTFVLDGLSQHFGHGWFDAYPPFHYYVLAAAISPMLTLQALAGVNIHGTAGHTILVLVFRLVSVAAGVGIVIAVCLSGAHAFGKRAGLFAAAIFAVTTPFLFYSKTANVDVPYLFWFALSLMFYLRLLDTLRLADFVLFAATATFAVCTKDQAYGLYLLAPFVVVEQLWRTNRRQAVAQPLRRALLDRRLAAAAITAAALFAACHNMLFNLNGFLDHVRFIVGPGSENYRQFEPTFAGHWELLRVTAYLIQVSMAWPMFVAGMAGLILAVAMPRHRRMAAWLLVPVVSYYLGFIDVILYNYDRFILPMCLVLAIFGGFAVDSLLEWSGRWRLSAVSAVAAMFAYTIFYAGTVDVLMIGDSRYEAEAWMTANVGSSDLVGVTELPELLPGLDRVRSLNISTIAELEQSRPRYFVINADYARSAMRSGVPGTHWAELLDGLDKGALGYHVVTRFRRPAPWPWLPGAHPDLVGARQEIQVFSVLRDINPMIEILRRDEE